MSRLKPAFSGFWIIGAAVLSAAPPVIPEAMKEVIRKGVDFGLCARDCGGLVHVDGAGNFRIGQMPAN